METQQLVPPYEVTVHHACLLKMYHEGGREVTEDLEAQIAFGDDGFHVECLDEARCVDGQHQVLVKWFGLDDEESSWEPAANLLDDIPVVFRKWAAANKEDPTVAALIKTLDFPVYICCLDEGPVAESLEEAGDKTPTTVTREVNRDYLVNKVIPAIRSLWPRQRSSVISIQQDNARPHVSVDYVAVRIAVSMDGWNIKLCAQPD
ncbi:hypothetical protein H257_18844 [Aphanomyces astaci]|uniref:Chromo domain-containing protein n=1 Tax=Aphanomyces astaci TaxID=112090 RepID=W4FBP9_APHAT|nr:hypothetical protein H257_18844 [Aphanomyces astaci]ETV64236.1 hypothetical protein H257_18844 [Aphanomyces astaci]|eukprot:XP_009846277.1 hypothetical protein H257_18844 [Aphanomyces astaci]